MRSLALLVLISCHPQPAPPKSPFTLESRILGETRRINVYTPPGYATGDTRYPILYMPDGGLEEDFPHVAQTIDSAIRTGEMRPVILVGIENTERRRDMTGPTEVEEDKKIAPHVGGSAHFRAFIRDELMPAVDQRVRGDGTTGIIGESLAGLFILETFFLEPDLFDVYVALSPSLWWDNQSLVRAAAEDLKAHPGLTATLWFATASDDGIEDAVKTLTDTLRSSAPPKLTWTYEPMLQEHHSTIYRAASPIALRKVFPPTTAHK